jgi:hypothetical protein
MANLAEGSGRRRLTALRLAAQRIEGARSSSPAEAVAWMLALQAQDLPGAKWSVGLRTAGATEAHVDAALNSGGIVRSWPMRGTLHLVAGEDLGWLLGLTGPRMIASWAHRRTALGITDADLSRARDVAIAALDGHRVLGRRALLATLDAAGIGTEGQRGYHVLGYLAQSAVVVLGPMDGRQQTFALLDEWVPGPRRLDGDEALGELALRYVRSHGPASDRDLARWAGLTLGDVRRGIGVCGGALEAIDVDGVRYHVGAGVPDAAGGARASVDAGRVHLLPGFDEYLLGYGDRSAALAPGHADAVVPGGNGLFKPTIVAGGTVVGTWRRTVSAREVRIEPAPFGSLPRPVRDGLEEAAKGYGTFLGRPTRLAWP